VKEDLEIVVGFASRVVVARWGGVSIRLAGWSYPLRIASNGQAEKRLWIRS